MNKTKRIVNTSLMAALVCVATLIIEIPTPMGGYVNLGDCISLLCGMLLSPAYAFAAAGIGGGVADLFAGYAVYAPATFVIKGALAITAHYLYKRLKGKLGEIPSAVIGGVCAEAVMVAGYLLYESFLYGFVPSLANVPANLIQGAVGIVLAILLLGIFKKAKILPRDK